MLRYYGVPRRISLGFAHSAAAAGDGGAVVRSMFLLEIRLRFLWAPAAARGPGRIAKYRFDLPRNSHAAARG